MKNMLLFLALSLILGTGCRMTPNEFEQWSQWMDRENNYWLKKSAELNEKKDALEKRRSQLEERKEILNQKTAILNREHEKLAAFWKDFQNKSHDDRKELFSMLNNSKEIFFNVRLGNPAVKRDHNLWVAPATSIIIMEMEQRFENECIIQTAELYTSNEMNNLPAKVYFAIFYTTDDAPNVWRIRCMSDAKVIKQGLNSFGNLSQQGELRAKKGDYFGVILGEGASVDYDEYELGHFQALQFNVLRPFEQRDFHFKMSPVSERISPRQPGNKDFAISFRGISVENAE